MKIKIVIILFLLLSIHASQAAFLIRPGTTTALRQTSSSETNGETSRQQLANFRANIKQYHGWHKIDFIRMALHPSHPPYQHFDGHGKPGWPGIVSFVCSLVSLLSFSAAIAAESVALLYLFGFFALGAVVLGIVGLSYDYQYHGLAIAGLVLGSFELALVAIILALVAAFNG